MKRLTFILLAFLIAGSIGAYNVIEVPEAVAISGTGLSYTGAGAGPSGANPCAGITGAVTYLYNGDYTSDTDAACSSAAAKLDGTLAGTYTVSANYFSSNNQNSYLQHAIDSSELPVDAATIWFSMYIADDGDGNMEQNQAWEISTAVWDANNYIYFRTAGDGAGAGYVSGVYRDNGATNSVSTAANSVDINLWYRCGYSFTTAAVSPDHSIVCVACGGGGTEADCSGKGVWTSAVSENDNVTALDATPEVISYGEKDSTATQADDVRIADVYILSGFQAADPF